MEQIKELLNKVTSGVKWYAVSADVGTQGYLRKTASRIRSGSAKPETIVSFFATFGYRVEFETKVIIH